MAEERSTCRLTRQQPQRAPLSPSPGADVIDAAALRGSGASTSASPCTSSSSTRTGVPCCTRTCGAATDSRGSCSGEYTYCSCSTSRPRSQKRDRALKGTLEGEREKLDGYEGVERHGGIRPKSDRLQYIGERWKQKSWRRKRGEENHFKWWHKLIAF